MKFRFTAIDRSLNRAELRWQGLRLLRGSAVLGIAICLLVIAWGVTVAAGFLASRPLAVAWLGAIAGGGLMALGLLVLRITGDSPDRKRIAAALENNDRRLLDRLNTLLFLERAPDEIGAEHFARRIASQAQTILRDKPKVSPFSARPALAWLGAFVAVMCVTLLLNRHFEPWQHLVSPAQSVKARGPQAPVEFARVPIETNHPWGEVRITDPGADLTVTKVDVVPLQIEAAANRPLTNVSWFSAVNGAKEAAHLLPATAEPCYGTYQPTIYLDELHVSDWDVLSYYARATTDRSNIYGSQVYFLEVRPFREDILKLPGGQGGKPYRTLSEISSLIGRQQHVIRQTYQHTQQPPASESMRVQDRTKLAAAEADLSDSAQHLYAKMAGELENKPIGDALDNLAKAEQSLGRASSLLQANALEDGQDVERRALSELVAARKTFQKAVSDQPGAFDEASPENESASPVADDAQKLNQMAEFRNEAKAAEDFIREALEKQKQLEQQARLQPRGDQPALGAQEKQLEKSLQDFQAQHPQVFNGATQQCEAAQQALAKAGSELDRQNGRQAAQNATHALQNFNDALQKQAANRQLADAYKLRQMLESEKQQLAQAGRSKEGAPDPQNAARSARQTVDQLKQAAEQEPTRGAFGQPLRDALSGGQKSELDEQLRQLEQGQDPGQRQRQAASAADALDKVAKAFDQSQPQSLQTARKSDPLKPKDEDGLAQGGAELDSLIKELEKNGQLAPSDQSKQGQQALQDLQNGMRSRFGDDASSQELLGRLGRALDQGTLNPNELKNLLQQIQRFAAESSEKLARREDQPDITNIDPSRLPPAYRDPIQKYFEKLSQPPSEGDTP